MGGWGGRARTPLYRGASFGPGRGDGVGAVAIEIGAARAVDAVKTYGVGDAAVHALAGVTVTFPTGAVHRDHGPVGLGQEHADAVRRRPRPADLGLGVHRRHRAVEAEQDRAHPAAARPPRLHLPAVQPDPDAVVAGEHPPAAHPGRRGRRTRRGSTRSSRPSAWRTGSTTCRASSRVASSSASPWPGRWCRARHRLRRRADRRARLAHRHGDPHLHAPRRRRHRPDHRDGHPRPARGVVRRQRAVPRRRPDHRRDARARPPTGCSTA